LLLLPSPPPARLMYAVAPGMLSVNQPGKGVVNAFARHLIALPTALQLDFSAIFVN